MTLPSTAHTALGPAESDTGNPLEDDADNVTGEAVITTELGGSNVITCDANDTVISLFSVAAGSYRQSPSWVAATSHRPGPTKLKVAPSRMQTESGFATSHTGKPLDDHAYRVTGESLITTELGGSNVITCDANDTSITRVTDAAGSYLPSPPWLAVTVQDPARCSVSLSLPPKMHTEPGATARDTGKPLDALAANPYGESVISSAWGGSNEIACVAVVTSIDRVAALAAMWSASPG